MSSQFSGYTLNQLKNRVDIMIKEQGENAPVAWWIFSAEDVVKYDDNGDEVRQPAKVCEEVLSNLREYDHIYEAIGDAISTELGECV